MYDARPASVKAFFILEQRNIYTWLCVPLTEHIKTHLTYFRENQSVRSEPQDTVLAVDVELHSFVVNQVEAQCIIWCVRHLHETFLQ